MKALIIYDSTFGNTEHIAQANTDYQRERLEGLRMRLKN